MKTLRVGVVGAGWMGAVHAASWQTNAPRAEIVAVADASESRAQHLTNQFTDGRAQVYTSIEALLSEPDIDAVDICLPHHLHAQAILQAARAGKAILCEKPLCTSLEDAGAIRTTLQETGITFMAAHNQLFQPSLIEARRLLDNAVLGRPYVFRSIEAIQNHRFRTGRPPVEMGEGESPWAWRADPQRCGGGEVLDTGWHATYRLLALANDRPVEVTAMLGNFFVNEIPTEDTGLLLVRFASGAIGEIVTSWAFNLINGWQFEVAGEHGSMAGSRNRLVHQLHGWSTPAERTHEPVHTFTEEITRFLNVVQRGEPNPAPFEQAALVLQLITAAYRSAADRCAIALPEDPTEPGAPAVGTGDWQTKLSPELRA